MLQITVFGFVTPKSLPSYAEIGIVGPTIVDADAAQTIAEFGRGTWGDRFEDYTRIDIQGPLELWCIDGDVQVRVGSFDSLALEREFLNSPNATVGRLTRGEWDVPVTGAYWPGLAIRSATPDPFASASSER